MYLKALCFIILLSAVFSQPPPSTIVELRALDDVFIGFNGK